jgi:hypothetical protein
MYFILLKTYSKRTFFLSFIFISKPHFRGGLLEDSIGSVVQYQSTCWAVYDKTMCSHCEPDILPSVIYQGNIQDPC